MNYGIGVSIFISSLILLVKTNGDISIFWDFPTFLYVVIGSLGLLMANKSFNEIKTFRLEARLYLVRCLERIGAVGAIIGFIQMLQNFSDPKSIGPAMAVCLLSVFYAQVFISIVIHKNEESQNQISLPLVILGATVGSFFIIVTSLK